MTQIHARSHPTCSKETKGYEFVVFCKVVNLIYTNTNRHRNNRAMCACVCVCQHYAIFWKYICIFWTDSKKTKFHCLHCIYSVVSTAAFIHLKRCVCIVQHMWTLLLTLFFHHHHPVYLFAVRYFSPFAMCFGNVNVLNMMWCACAWHQHLHIHANIQQE